MKAAKQYVLKVNLPGGYKKGDTVSTFTRSMPLWDKDQKICIYSPKDEPEFFEIYVPPIPAKFAVGDTVKPANAFAGFKGYGVITKVIPCATHHNKTSYVYDLNITGRSHRVSEGNLIKLVPYWFISSTGKVQSDILGRDKDVELFRIATKNYFGTKETADAELAKIKTRIAKVNDKKN